MDQKLPKGYRGVNYPAGKGDKQRPQDHNKYRNKYDQIDWSKGKEKNHEQQRNANH